MKAKAWAAEIRISGGWDIDANRWSYLLTVDEPSILIQPRQRESSADKIRCYKTRGAALGAARRAMKRLNLVEKAKAGKV